MRRRSVTLLAGLLLLAATAPLRGIEAISTNRFDLATNDVLRGELWMLAGTASLAGRAEDDLFILCTGTATDEKSPPAFQLTGTVLGDLWAGGENVAVKGAVGRHARVFGIKTAVISAKVDRNLMAMANAVQIDSGGEIQGDCIIVARDVIADGIVHGDAAIIGQHVTLAGDFRSNITVTATDITVMPGTRIAGNLRYLMDKDLVLDSSVSLGGRIMRMEPEPPAPVSPTGGLALQLGLYAAALLVGMAFTSLFPGLAASGVNRLYLAPWRCLLQGFVAFCLIPMSALVLLMTLVGIPMSLLLLLAYPMAIYLGKIPVALLLGHFVLRRGGRTTPAPFLLTLVIGLLVVYAAVNLPFPVGLAAWFAITFAGIGAMVGAIIERRSLPFPPPPVPADAPPPLPTDGRMT